MAPPLRERSGDIPLLAEHFLRVYSDQLLTQKPTLSNAVLSILIVHAWPGNVRELQNIIQFAITKCDGPVLRPDHLPQSLSERVIEKPRARQREPKINAEDVSKALQRAKDNKSRAAQILGVSRSTLYRHFER